MLGSSRIETRVLENMQLAFLCLSAQIWWKVGCGLIPWWSTPLRRQRGKNLIFWACIYILSSTTLSRLWPTVPIKTGHLRWWHITEPDREPSMRIQGEKTFHVKNFPSIFFSKSCRGVKFFRLSKEEEAPFFHNLPFNIASFFSFFFFFSESWDFNK